MTSRGEEVASKMSRSVPTLCLLLSCVVGLPACSSDDEPTPPPMEEEPFFPADFKDTFPLVRDCRLSIAHDLFSIRVYVNPEAADAYNNGVYPFEEGTVCVKTLANEGDCSDLAGYASMRKGPPGSAPESGDWEWQSLDADRKILASGALTECIDCHTSCTEGRDYTCTNAP